jgi:hypothetical protein
LEEIFLTNCKLLFFDADVAMLKSEVTPGASLTGEPDMFYHQTFYYSRSYRGPYFLKEMVFLLQMSKCKREESPRVLHFKDGQLVFTTK